MEDKDWQILKVLYDKKNITKAAETLFTSQPAISNRLRQMEEEFGVKIVRRTSKGIYFTPQGEYLAKSANAVLLQIRQIKDQVLNMEEDVTGTLRLGASNYFTKYKLPNLLKQFKTLHPNVEFKVTNTWSQNVLVLLDKNDIQVGFVRGNQIWSGEMHLLIEEPICITSKEDFEITDLPNLPRIDYQTEPTHKTLIDNWWKENLSRPPLISLNVDKVDTCKEMVVNGLGYAFLPGMMVNEADNLRKVIITDKKGTPIFQKTWLIYRNESLETRVVKAFVDFVKTVDFQAISL